MACPVSINAAPAPALVGRESTWPASPLDAAQQAFALLNTPPTALAFDGRLVEGLPDRPIPLDGLRRWLIDDDTPRAVRDDVWRHVVQHARSHGPAWVLAAIGLAMPGLRRRAGRLAAGWHGETADLDAELLAGFLERLTTIDLDAPNICARLIDAGARAVRRARDSVRDNDTIRVQDAWGPPPPRPWDHPDWVLTRALRAAVIDPEECLLISATRLDDVPLRVVADRLGVSVDTASTWRRAGELRLVEALRSGDLDWVPLTATARRRTQSVRDAISCS